ncbi:MAG: hypothetical protein SFU84_01365 [Gemmatimonadales bacterium]|nr:hypothetical protein [Gemmatimonadales bacterium]
MRRLLLAAALLHSAALPGQEGDAAASGRARATAINRELLRIASAGPLWPGYRPESIPLAIYTGDRTYLFRHPAPPAEFVAVDDMLSMAGRHPAATSNSSANIGGVVTATLLADGSRARLPVSELAAVAIHEAFHVFQRAAHPRWQGNEGDLFTYPADRADLLRLRREESEYLRRALSRPSDRACLTREAMTRRAERFAAMDAAHAAYERDSEMNEGLATYVQFRAMARTTVAIPVQEYPATGVRDRFYTVGPALAFLLDGVRPGWQTELERNDSLRLDQMLAEAASGASGTCRLPANVTTRIARRATADAKGVGHERLAGRMRFDRRPGWRLIIEPAAGVPLWPQGFDPLNVTQVSGGTLHHRLLKLGNDSLSINFVDGEGADHEALTEAAGAHPLFNGIRRVEIVLAGRPTITREGGAVAISAPGVGGRFLGAVVVEEQDRIVVRVRR